MEMLFGVLVFMILKYGIVKEDDEVFNQIIDGVCINQNWDKQDFIKYLGVLLDLTPFVEKIEKGDFESGEYIFNVWKDFVEEMLT